MAPAASPSRRSAGSARASANRSRLSWRPLDHARFPYVYLDATYLHGRLGRNLQVVSRAVVVAIGINALGYREVLGIAVGESEAKGFWRLFLGSLKERGLAGTRLVISDAHLGLTAAIQRMFQG